MHLINVELSQLLTPAPHYIYYIYSNSYARVIDAVLRMLYRIYSIHSLKKCNVFNRAKKNSPGSVDLYAKCIKEGPVEWTKPERALEAAKNVWTKSKLRLVSTSVTTVYILLER